MDGLELLLFLVPDQGGYVQLQLLALAGCVVVDKHGLDHQVGVFARVDPLIRQSFIELVVCCCSGGRIGSSTHTACILG